MKRNFKRVLLVVLSFALALCMLATVAACGGAGHETLAPPENDGLEKIEYSITVLYPDGTAVVGVDVRLVTFDDEPYSGATTGSDGVAKIRAGKGLEYYIAINDLPNGYVYESEDELAADETSKIVYLESENASNAYKLSVVTAGGMAMKNVTVSLKDGGNVVSSKVTNEEGVVNIRVPALKEYAIELTDLPTGYTVVGNAVTSSDGGEQTVTVTSSVITDAMPKNYRYKMDDIMYDFSVTTSDGKTFKLSDILKEKKFVFINFWATWCTPCKAEFEDMEMAYEKYKDDVAIIALSTSDTLAQVVNFKAGYSPQLTFDMAVDEGNLYSTFSEYAQNAVPTSIFVDQYGKICNYIRGRGTEALFNQEFARYTADDYVQKAYDPNNDETPIETVDKPDVEMDSSEAIVKAIHQNGFTGTYSAEEDGTTWPWVLKDGALSAGNLKHRNTTAIVYFEFTLKEGEFLTFDYKTNTEDVGNADIFSAYIDGSKMLDFDRITDGWKTCSLYTPIAASVDPNDANETHTLMLVYTKDSSDGWLSGEEFVSIKNVRSVKTNELTGDVNVFREAAWNYNEDTKQWQNYITPVYNETDGYYHVGSADGPYLLMNMCSGTRYSNLSISEYSGNGYFKMAGISAFISYISNGLSNPPYNSYISSAKGYSWFGTYSSIPDYCLVDRLLKETIDTMAKQFAKTKYNGEVLANYYNENVWLEFCRYYDHYAGEDMGKLNPLTGLCEKEAIEIMEIGKENAIHAVIDRTLVPRGIMYRFDCQTTGAYRIWSDLAENKKYGGFVYVEGIGVNESQDANENFDLYASFEAGKTYYISVAFGLPNDWGEMDFYIDFVGETHDELSYATPGGYTWMLDENGNAIYDEDDNVVIIILRTANVHAELDRDGYYHQILNYGESGEMIDNGATSYMWIDMLGVGNMFDYSLKEIAQGYYVDSTGKQVTIGFEELSNGKIGFFDFSKEAGEEFEGYREDYTQTILEYAEQAEKGSADDPDGMVKANAELVKLLTLALSRIDHDSEDDWFSFACFYRHFGVYAPEK